MIRECGTLRRLLKNRDPAARERERDGILQRARYKNQPTMIFAGEAQRCIFDPSTM